MLCGADRKDAPALSREAAVPGPARDELERNLWASVSVPYVASQSAGGLIRGGTSCLIACPDRRAVAGLPLALQGRRQWRATVWS